MFTQSVSQWRAPLFRRRIGAMVALAAMLISGTSFSSANSLEAESFPRRNTSWMEEYSGIISSIEASRDVLVFPIQVAGTATVLANRGVANKVAQAAGVGGIAVIYPDIGEPYRSVFTQIIDGIEDKAKGRVANFAVGPNVDVSQLNDSLRRQETKVVIALGRQGMKVANLLDGNIGVVVGGCCRHRKTEPVSCK